MAPPRQQQRRQGSRRLGPPATSQSTFQRSVKDDPYYDAMEHGHHNRGSEIFVGGLARSVTEDMIKEMFLPYGEILDLRMMKDHSGISKGYCFVRFSTKDAALKAQKERNGFLLKGKKIGVEPSSDQDCLFFGNLCKDWNFEEFDKLIHKAFQDVVCVDLAMPSNSGHPASGKMQPNRDANPPVYPDFQNQFPLISIFTNMEPPSDLHLSPNYPFFSMMGAAALS